MTFPKTYLKIGVWLAGLYLFSELMLSGYLSKRFAPFVGAAGGATLYFWILFPLMRAPFGIVRKRDKGESRPG